MSPVVVCFGALDAALIAQAAYRQGVRATRAKDEEKRAA